MIYFLMAGRATPEKLMTYKLALQLYKTYNIAVPSIDWMNINFNSINNFRQTKFAINKTNNLKVGMNVLSNRLWCLNGIIDLNWLNSSFETFKIKCKQWILS